jgi:hypothetical protein
MYINVYIYIYIYMYTSLHTNKKKTIEYVEQEPKTGSTSKGIASNDKSYVETQGVPGTNY